MASVSRLKKVAAFTVCVSGLSLFAGCSLSLPPYNRPLQERLAIVSRSPQDYAIRIATESGATTLVPADGRVLVDIPALPRECSAYFLGIIRVSNGHPEERRVVELLRRGRRVKKLSIRDLNGLPADADGWRRLVVR